MNIVKNIWLLYCLVIFPSAVFPQNTIVVNCKVLHNKSGLLKQFNIIVDGKMYVTNDAGIAQLSLLKNSTHFRVALQENRLAIIYPGGGYVAIPRDLNDMPEIIIGSNNENLYLNEYMKVYSEIKSNKTATSSQLKNLTIRLDSLEKLLISLHYSETDLRNAKELQDGKDKYMPEITETLIAFRSSAYDFKSAFKNLASFSLNNNNALQELQRAVTTYSDRRDLLDRQHINYEKYIGDYWQNDALKKQLHELNLYALDTMHKQKYLPMQEVITQINTYQLKKDNGLRQTILSNIENALPAMDESWKKLDIIMKDFLTDISY